MKTTTKIMAVFLVVLSLASPSFAGQIVAWGSNNSGQLDVPAGNDFVAIAAGRDYSLALRSDGSIMAWGLNTYGSVDNVPDGNDFVAIAASGFPSHNLALKSDGSIVGWGTNRSGQCDAPSDKNFVAIGVGDYHSLGLTSEGSIIAWGGNHYGVLNVPKGNDFIKIAAGPLHNLAIRSDGSLVGWGYKSYGECDVPAGNNFVEVGAGAFYSVALKSDGSLAAWGLDHYGCVNNLPSGNDFVAISVGSYWYGLAIKADGSLVAWGGRREVPDGNSFVAIAAGDRHCLAITTKIATLVEVEIVGPNDVRKNYQAQYKALAHYDDGTTRNATNSAFWWAEPEAIATIDKNGLLTTEDINEPEEITIYAEYTESEITFGAQMTVQVSLPQTWCVPADYETIQSAIDAAEYGDTVLVADGTYTGPGNRDIDFLGKAITVRSESGPKSCIIDCMEEGRGFHFHNNEDANSILTGFTIINGYAIYPGGGGISCYKSSPTIANCIISGNLAISSGADGGDGGGIFCYGSPTISNCIISANLAINEMRGGEGGGIYCSGSPTITNCTITGNLANNGGGICCQWGSSPKISNCTITSNTARTGGGVNCGYKSGLTFENCIIGGNSSDYGGGIYCSRSSLTITNCTFAENSSPNGSALACDSYQQKYPSNVQLTNCILWDGGDEILNNDGSTITITYSDVQGGYTGEGNIDADPCFVEPGYWADANDPNIIVEPNDPNAVWIEGDYYLLPDSLCIDAGDPNFIPELDETDIDGNPRVIDGRIDMGAYEAMVSCFGVNHVKLGTKAGKKGDDIKIKGTFNPGVPIDLMIDDVMYTIDDGPGHVFSFLIPAGSFELEGKGDKDKYKFHSPKGSVPEIEAKFDFDKCKFEFKAKKVAGIDEITSTSLEIILQAGANIAQEIVELEVKGKKGEHLEYKRKPKFECCPEM